MQRLVRALPAAVLVLTLACGSSAVAPTDPATVRTEIQALYDRRVAALAKGDARELEATYDTSRPTLRRFNNDALEYARRGFVEGVTRVVAIEPYRDHYVRAYVLHDTELIFGTASASHAVTEYVRRIDGRWVMSEPLDDELGASRERTGDGVTVTHFAIQDDLAPLIHDAVRRARTEVARFAPRGFVAETRVRLYPTLTSRGAGASTDTIWRVQGGETFLPPISLGIDRVTGALSDITQFVVRQTTAYHLRAEIQPAIEARLSRDEWLNKGWVSFAAGYAVRPDFFKAACGGVAPLSLKYVSAEPDSRYSRDYPTYYAYQTAMVEYLYERYGPRAYWDLLEAFRADADSRIIFPKVLKITPDAFYADWLIWAKKKHC